MRPKSIIGYSFLMTRGLVHYRFLAPIALTAGLLFAQQTDSPDYGPPNGTLFIVGGGNLTGTGIMETFVNRAGGPGAKIIVVPTAGGNKDRDGKWIVYKGELVIAPCGKLGATNVHMLPPQHPQE